MFQDQTSNLEAENQWGNDIQYLTTKCKINLVIKIKLMKCKMIGLLAKKGKRMKI